MSEPIASAIPTSADRRSHRPPPAKRARLNPSASATTEQARTITTLFLQPDKEITIPPPSTTTTASLPPPPEIVANVQGSSAGAGSGEFHVYKASRRREMERLRRMEEEASREGQDEEWEAKMREKRAEDEERLRRNREKRRRKKEKKGGKGKEDGNGEEGDGEAGCGDAGVLVQTTGIAADGGVKVPTKNGVNRDKDKDGDGTGDEVLNENGIGVAKVVEEVSVTIHDDDDD